MWHGITTRPFFSKSMTCFGFLVTEVLVGKLDQLKLSTLVPHSALWSRKLLLLKGVWGGVCSRRTSTHWKQTFEWMRWWKPYMGTMTIRVQSVTKLFLIQKVINSYFFRASTFFFCGNGSAWRRKIPSESKLNTDVMQYTAYQNK